MFTPGRIVFASLFVIAFVAMMVISYKRDAANNKKHYQNGAKYVGAGIIITILLLFLFKYITKNI